MDPCKSCTKTTFFVFFFLLLFHWCQHIDNPATERKWFCYYRKWLAKQLFQRLCFVRGRKQLAAVWLCRRHWLSVHAERWPTLIKSQRRRIVAQVAWNRSMLPAYRTEHGEVSRDARSQTSRTDGEAIDVVAVKEMLEQKLTLPFAQGNCGKASLGA